MYSADRRKSARSLLALICLIVLFLANIPPTVGIGPFIRPKATRHLKCASVLDGKHPNYVNHLAQHRITMQDPPAGQFPVDCKSIRARHTWQRRPASKEEANFPIAHSRVVYKDYVLLELMLAATYQPQNWYCYAVDSKAPKLFRSRMNALAKCFPNVIIAKKSRDVTRFGNNMDWAQHDCLLHLDAQGHRWRYVHMLQNHDIPLMTNLENVRVLKWMNGSNSVETKNDKLLLSLRINPFLDWRVGSLDLLRHPRRYKELGIDRNMQFPFVHGANQVTLSRAAVHYILTEVNVYKIIAQLDRRDGFPVVDEILIPSLNAFEQLKIPGSFTRKCLDQGVDTSYFTRKSHWQWEGSSCRTNNYRHWICVFGIEDLHPTLTPMPHFFVNKLMPEFDFGAIACWLESLFKRGFVQHRVKNLPQRFYRTRAQVRFNNLRNRNGRVPHKLRQNFNCLP